MHLENNQNSFCPKTKFSTNFNPIEYVKYINKSYKSTRNTLCYISLIFIFLVSSNGRPLCWCYQCKFFTKYYSKTPAGNLVVFYCFNIWHLWFYSIKFYEFYHVTIQFPAVARQQGLADHLEFLFSFTRFGTLTFLKVFGFGLCCKYKGIHIPQSWFPFIVSLEPTDTGPR